MQNKECQTDTNKPNTKHHGFGKFNGNEDLIKLFES